MNAFQYDAKRKDGSTLSGTVEAVNRRAALDLLADRELFPLRLERLGGIDSEIEAASATAGVAGATDVASGKSQVPTNAAASTRSTLRVPRKEVTLFTREMATLLAAAVPIPSALAGLGEQCENEVLRRVILELATAVRGGDSLSRAMGRYSKLFPTFYVSMVEVGEEAGALDRVLADLADLLERDDEVRSEVASAIAYPCFVLGLGVVTTFVLLVFVLPRIFAMLDGMDAVLPLPTRVLLATAQFFGTYWWLILASCVGVLVWLRWYVRTPAGAVGWDQFKLRLPVLGGLFRVAALGRFSRMLGTLERSGVPLLKGLEVVTNTVGNRVISRSIEQVTADTRGGDSLARPLRKVGLLPPTMVQLIAIGEETGQLDNMLLRVAAIQERHLRGRSRAVVSLLGPILILCVGAIVGFIVIALLLPIFQMSQALR